MVGNVPKRFYLLDVLRGFASLTVVVWHYQQFFQIAPTELPEGFDRASQPFYFLLFPLYEKGLLGVHLFFVLSGFVFFYMYADSIRDRTVSAYTFFVYRFSRLYPLFFVTLVYVAVVQLAAKSQLGTFLVYPENGLKYFLINLFVATSWGQTFEYSFNAPTWSVSVEIFLYAVFFVTLLWVGRRKFVFFGLMIAGSLLAFHLGKPDIGFGLFCFFAGGFVFLIYEHWSRQPGQLLPLLITISALALSSILYYVYTFTQFASYTLEYLVLFGGCFPSLVLLLALLQNIDHTAGRSVKIIGDVTYSTYLLHFPIQLSAIWITKRYDIAIDYTQAVWFLLFLFVVILVSIPTYYYFELPAQRFFRRQLRPVDHDRDYGERPRQSTNKP